MSIFKSFKKFCRQVKVVSDSRLLGFNLFTTRYVLNQPIFTSDDVTFVRSGVEPDDNIPFIFLTKDGRGNPIIIVNEKFWEMGENFQKSFVAHEKSHIANNHLKNMGTFKSIIINTMRLFKEPEMEIIADRDAAISVGFDNYINALKEYRGLIKKYNHFDKRIKKLYESKEFIESMTAIDIETREAKLKMDTTINHSIANFKKELEKSIIPNLMKDIDEDILKLCNKN